MSSLIYELESSPGGPDGATSASLDGTWRLLWSSVEPFRSSPFFWVFQDGLVQNRAIAARIFQFTDRCVLAGPSVVTLALRSTQKSAVA